MANQNVCRYFKFGYCKFLKKCRLVHACEICQNSSCEIRCCSLRHHKTCKYFRDYRRCKFGEYCYFLHKENENENSVNEIRIKIEDNQKKIDVLEKQIGENTYPVNCDLSDDMIESHKDLKNT